MASSSFPKKERGPSESKGTAVAVFRKRVAEMRKASLQRAGEVK